MLAKKFDNAKHKIVGWLASEKIDGIRATWDGRRMVSRSGKEIRIPKIMKTYLPGESKLDGELHYGRGNFPKTIQLIHADEPNFSGLRYAVFDAPMPDVPFGLRVKYVDEVCRRIRKRAPRGRRIPIHPVKHIAVKSLAHARSMLKEVLDVGGEGVIVRHPQSLYRHGRSNLYLKLKPVVEIKGVVVGFEPGVVGSNEIRLENGAFTFIKGKRLPVGKAVVVEAQQILASGAPRFGRIK